VSWTQADLDAVEAAIAKGEKSVSFADRNVVYKSTDELVAVRRLINQELNPQPKTVSAFGSKGF
jgi:hypothetical protein